MKKRDMKHIFIGMLIMAIVFSAIDPSIADSFEKKITISSGIRLFVDDTEIFPTDGNGKPVEVFSYNGTTYLPVKSVATIFGKNIAWDGKSRSVFIGKHDPNKIIEASIVLTPKDYISNEPNNYVLTIKQTGSNETKHKIYYSWSMMDSKGTSYTLKDNERPAETYVIKDDALIRTGIYDGGNIVNIAGTNTIIKKAKLGESWTSKYEYSLKNLGIPTSLESKVDKISKVSIQSTAKFIKTQDVKINQTQYTAMIVETVDTVKFHAGIVSYEFPEIRTDWIVRGYGVVKTVIQRDAYQDVYEMKLVGLTE